MKRSTMLAAAILATSGTAWAHTFGAHGAEWESGLLHPLFGLDHMLAMVAVGLWAAQRGGKMLWALPLTFVALMGVGGALGMSGAGLPLVESGIAASVLVLGLLVATAARLPGGLSIGMIALFALFHGHAHGTELAQTASAIGYSVGFMISTALLHAVGVGAGLLTLRSGRLRPAVQRLAFRSAGGVVAATGLILLIV